MLSTRPTHQLLALILLWISWTLVFSQRKEPVRVGQRYRRMYRSRWPAHHDECLDNTCSKKFSVSDMDCQHFQQPLNHFDLPRGQSGTFLQRYCVYNGFVVNETTYPVFFYAGNESPLEEYINNTGLIWESAPRLGAQVVFVEHRYEGQSYPAPNIANCLAYSSSVQALADYARWIETFAFGATNSTSILRRRPVIAFGGSYGGMLASWLRMKYPNTVAGAIAGSAPIWGFPRNFPTKIDAAYRVILRGLSYPYPPTNHTQKESNCCGVNLRAAWPLMHVMGQHDTGRQMLSRAFALCERPLASNQTHALMDWAKSVWFDLAEASFPYPSSYVPYALTHRDIKLPAWPLQAACWNVSKLHQDFGVSIAGNVSDVNYVITYGSELQIRVDWDKAELVTASPDWTSVLALLESVRDAVSIWYNMTHDVRCYNLTAAPNRETNLGTTLPNESVSQSWHAVGTALSTRQLVGNDGDQHRTKACQQAMKERGSWAPLCCNEDMRLIITDAMGLGRDVFWPPSHPRGTVTYDDVMAAGCSDDSPCPDPLGAFGFPQGATDVWSTWMDTLYGGTSIQAHSNIIFSNGLLDPWSAAGVYAAGEDPTDWALSASQQIVDGLYVQNITTGSDRMIALIMELGGHHTDLMFSNEADPPSIVEARKIEKAYIDRWIREWWSTARA